MEKGGVHTLEGITSHRLSKEMIKVDLNQTYVGPQLKNLPILLNKSKTSGRTCLMCTPGSPLSSPGSTPPSFPTEVLHPASSHSLEGRAKVALTAGEARIKPI